MKPKKAIFDIQASDYGSHESGYVPMFFVHAIKLNGKMRKFDDESICESIADFIINPKHVSHFY